SALRESNGRSKVEPIDTGGITRARAWLREQMDTKGGTWSNIGATHGESITRMGDPKVLLTSYVVIALLDSGTPKDQVKKSIDYIRENVKKADNAYILALAANALAAYDPNDDSTLEVLKVLEKKRQDNDEQKTTAFPAGGQSLSYGRGDSLTVETTALTALAMLRTNQFHNVAN